MKQVKVSAKNAHLRFHGCTPEYIRDNCHGRCCEGSAGLKVTVHPTEVDGLAALGATFNGNFIQPSNPVARGAKQRCPFKTAVNLCGLHSTDVKPFGCIASPFTLNRNDTLIVRNRYKLLICYGKEPRLPAYVAFRASLDLLFGLDESARICAHLDAGGDDIIAQMSEQTWQMLRDNDEAKRA